MSKKKKEPGESFVMYKSIFLSIDMLPDAESKWQLMERVCRFGLDLISEEEASDNEGLSLHQMSILYAVIPVIAASVNRYKEGIRTGSKGGRPTKKNHTVSKKENGTVSENGNGTNVNDNANGNGNGNADEYFSSFWTAYPKKKDKRKAHDAFLRLFKSGELPGADVLLEAIRKQRNSKQWQEAGGQFIPLPTSWLNGRRWEDELDVTVAGSIGDLNSYLTMTEEDYEF